MVENEERTRIRQKNLKKKEEILRIKGKLKLKR
jgi:hypothetical protein